MLEGLGPTNTEDSSRQEATVRLDFLRKEKKAVQNKAQMAA